MVSRAVKVQSEGRSQAEQAWWSVDMLEGAVRRIEASGMRVVSFVLPKDVRKELSLKGLIQEDGLWGAKIRRGEPGIIEVVGSVAGLRPVKMVTISGPEAEKRVRREQKADEHGDLIRRISDAAARLLEMSDDEYAAFRQRLCEEGTDHDGGSEVDSATQSMVDAVETDREIRGYARQKAKAS